MIRLALWIIASLVVTVLIAWLAAVPGTVTLDVAGWRVEPQIGTALFLLALFVVLIIVLWSLVRWLMRAPGALARRSRERRRIHGIDALSQAFIALQAGDAGRARHLARDARQRLPNNPAPRLLEARADLALGEMSAAREHYRALISDDRTAMAALLGLYEQARAQHRTEAALTFARKAIALEPASPWASDAVFGDLVKRGAWAQAVAMVNDQPASGRSERAAKQRKQAVIETARARETEISDPLAALDHALTALKLIPDFVPAALIAARIHSHRGEVRRALSLLRRVWRATEHPQVALLYAGAQPGAAPTERLKRTRELITTPPRDRSSAMVLARAAIDAADWPLAREALGPYIGEPTQGIASLMAELEEGETGDHGKAREWLARAVRAPRDPCWTADGITSDEWEPVSPITGRLDAFEWKVPVTAVSVPVSDTRPMSSQPDDAPAIAEPQSGTALPLAPREQAQ
ncbi:membrane protein [Devosia pacifica]|uniref:Membrane protein n=1 Tax=Devosia pacifica TaxID=1335967 RepID=A0A918S6J4_9HYPH|nr:heme biosynthesis HemY N-terminal domain-containing protein [Devosia pacifica]GHA23572.1 membrane protein [Devosia pacifica]